MTDKFSKQIKQKMEGFEKPALELSWSEIDSLLDKRAAISRALEPLVVNMTFLALNLFSIHSSHFFVNGPSPQIL